MKKTMKMFCVACLVSVFFVGCHIGTGLEGLEETSNPSVSVKNKPLTTTDTTKTLATYDGTLPVHIRKKVCRNKSVSEIDKTRCEDTCKHKGGVYLCKYEWSSQGCTLLAVCKEGIHTP